MFSQDVVAGKQPEAGNMTFNFGCWEVCRTIYIEEKEKEKRYFFWSLLGTEHQVVSDVQAQETRREILQVRIK